ncbi:hypothetical protein QFZ52_001002 [Arthrobacter woluwensis]|uniref:DUF6966 domain-containing protein n=1 Tax=Arthrobacter woluwensis TaxID=156980 RepID=UPI00277E70E5|nr:hypothetical protein [Arthrobacter woluwensis]MDQ0708350.1 hypothetical protein [Arthrobacter woluwensis]
MGKLKWRVLFPWRGNSRARRRVELMTDLSQLNRLLDDCDVRHWPSWASQGLVLLESDEPRGLSHIRRAYGGMGSLNDVILSVRNGHRLAVEDEKAVNDQFRALCSLVYDHTVWLQEDLEGMRLR